MKLLTKAVNRGGVLALATFGLVACGEEPMDVHVPVVGGGPDFATTITEYEPYTPPQAADGAYLLAKACDVLIGEPPIDVEDGVAEEVPTKYAHQLLVSVPEGSTIRLVADPSIPLPEGITRDVLLNEQGEPDPNGTVFGCDARDPDDPTRPVIDPATDHSAKGNGPAIHTAGITFHLNGHGIHSYVSATSLDPLYDNLGIVVTGADVTVTNTSAVSGDGRTGVSVISDFAHNVDVESPRATIAGRRIDHDGSFLTPAVYNFVTTGGVGSDRAGDLVIDQIQSLGVDAVEGVGLEIRRCAPGSSTVITNSHLEGSGAGVSIRECSGVTLENNFISGHQEYGITTREVVSTSNEPIVIRGNTITGNALSGILWGRESVDQDGLTIAGNTITEYGQCGIQVSDDPNISSWTMLMWELTNFFDGGTRTCRRPA